LHSSLFIVASATLVAIGALASVWPPALWSLAVVLPLISLGICALLQTEHAIRRNLPLFGRGRWIMESLRPYVRQYFVESDTDGVPISRMSQGVAYQRAKGADETGIRPDFITVDGGEVVRAPPPWSTPTPSACPCARPWSSSWIA
jgi:hypothetical protein